MKLVLDGIQKFHEKTPRGTLKERNGGGKGKKKREILGLPPFRGPTLSGPHPSDVCGPLKMHVLWFFLLCSSWKEESQKIGLAKIGQIFLAKVGLPQSRVIALSTLATIAMRDCAFDSGKMEFSLDELPIAEKFEHTCVGLAGSTADTLMHSGPVQFLPVLSGMSMDDTCLVVAQHLTSIPIFLEGLYGFACGGPLKERNDAFLASHSHGK